MSSTAGNSVSSVESINPHRCIYLMLNHHFIPCNRTRMTVSLTDSCGNISVWNSAHEIWYSLPCLRGQSLHYSVQYLVCTHSMGKRSFIVSYAVPAIQTKATNIIKSCLGKHVHCFIVSTLCTNLIHKWVDIQKHQSYINSQDYQCWDNRSYLQNTVWKKVKILLLSSKYMLYVILMLMRFEKSINSSFVTLNHTFFQQLPQAC